MRVGGSGVYEHETKSTTKVVVCFKRAGAGWSLIAHVHEGFMAPSGKTLE
jgi:hypothetical protein